MARLVDVDELKLELKWLEVDTPVYHDVMSTIDEMPTVEPKHGHWINANEGIWNTVDVLKCSVCGEIDNRMYRSDAYCPYCGAKMDEVTNETY